MNKEQEAYIKGVAHSIEVYAETMRQCAMALQRNSLRDMPVELLKLNLRDITEPCQHIQHILAELTPNFPQQNSKAEQCEVCEEEEGPFIQVEVLEEEGPPRWLQVCSDDCLGEVVLRHKQIGEIIRPS
jgi:hypothetical protein